MMVILTPSVSWAQGAAIVFYWPCLIDVPMPELLKSRHTIVVDGKTAGAIGACEIRKVTVKPGERAVKFVTPMFPDISGAFGLHGPKYDVAPGQTLYIRLRYYQYVEPQVVSASVARSDMAQMSKQ